MSVLQLVRLELEEAGLLCGPVHGDAFTIHCPATARLRFTVYAADTQIRVVYLTLWPYLHSNLEEYYDLADPESIKDLFAFVRSRMR